MSHKTYDRWEVWYDTLIYVFYDSYFPANIIIISVSFGAKLQNLEKISQQICEILF